MTFPPYLPLLRLNSLCILRGLFGDEGELTASVSGDLYLGGVGELSDCLGQLLWYHAGA